MTAAPALAFGDLLRRYRLAAGLTQQALTEHAGLRSTPDAGLEGTAELSAGRRGPPSAGR